MNHLTKLSLIGVFLLCSLAACSAVFGQYHFDTWTTDNGLPQNGLRQITQTPDGYLWFTTFDGLVRFDGVRFTVFNKSNTKGIINSRFTGLYSDKDGTLYATTMEDGTLTIYRNGFFTSMSSDRIPGHYINLIEPDKSGELRFLVEDDDRKTKSWYSLKNGVFEYIETQGKFNEAIHLTGKFGSQWTITPTGATEIKDDISYEYPVDLTKINFRVNVFEDSEGTVWLGENSVHRLRNGEVRTYDEHDGLPHNSIYHSFWQDQDGSVWFASGGGSSGGIGLIQIKNEQLSMWGSEHGLPNTSIMDVFNDREGTAWLATNRGLVRRRRQFIDGFSTKDGINHSEVYPILRDHQDNVWIGTTKGLSIFQDGKFKSLDLKSPPNAPPDETWRDGRMSVQSLWEDAGGKMWIGLDGGIFIAKDGRADMIVETKSYHVFAIKDDRLGNVWAATNKGLIKFKDQKIVAEYSAKDGLPNDFMTFVFEDSRGGLWFGGYGGLTQLKDGQFINYTKKEGLAGNYVRTIHEDTDGTMWVGTYDEGLSRFKDGRFVNIKQENGLYNNGVFAIEEADNGYFWISSNLGIYRVKRQELNDFADGNITRIGSVGYGKEDGMLSNECNGGRQPASFRDKEGKFWFPTQEGIAIVDPMADRPNPMPPSVVIEDVSVEREPVSFRDGLMIEPGQKDLEIRYTGISLIKSDQIKFQYKLEGHDTDWVDAGTRRTAYYSYLPPGNYTFHVKAGNSDGYWNEKGTDLKIELKPYFYQTRLFLLLGVLMAAVVLFVVWKVSVHQLESRERRLSRLVRARTEELAEANDNLQKLANSDGLTKIGNRRRFESFLVDEWHRAVRFKTEISLIMIDIDHFKLFNDTYGHQAGDECLQKVAEGFADTIKRPTDLVARFGGEEFAIVLGGTDAAGALQIAEEAVESVKRLAIPHDGSTTSDCLTVSAGVATMFAKFDLTETDLVKAADLALYQAKENGRDRIHAYDHFRHISMNADVLTLDILPDERSALLSSRRSIDESALRSLD